MRGATEKRGGRSGTGKGGEVEFDAERGEEKLVKREARKGRLTLRQGARGRKGVHHDLSKMMKTRREKTSLEGTYFLTSLTRGGRGIFRVARSKKN